MMRSAIASVMAPVNLLKERIWPYLPENEHLRRIVVIVPCGFIVGASVETFMLNTGFYEIVKKKEIERRRAKLQANEQYWEERKQRAAAGKLQVAVSNNDMTSVSVSAPVSTSSSAAPLPYDLTAPATSSTEHPR